MIQFHRSPLPFQKNKKEIIKKYLFKYIFNGLKIYRRIFMFDYTFPYIVSWTI